MEKESENKPPHISGWREDCHEAGTGLNEQSGCKALPVTGDGEAGTGAGVRATKGTRRGKREAAARRCGGGGGGGGGEWKRFQKENRM